jgi:LysM repeat protein
MNTPNPLVPQGALPQGAPGKFNIRLVVFGIIAAHSLFFSGLLIQGCSKPKEDAKAKAPETLPPIAQPPPVETVTGAPPVAAAPLAPPAITPGITPGITPPATSPAPPAMSPLGASPLAPLTPPTTIEPVVIPPMEGTREHVVAKGDSFYSIAKKYKVTQAAVAKANPSVDSTKLKLGQKLQVPAGSAAPTTTASVGGAGAMTDSGNVYVVKSGDTLSRVASKNGTTIKALREVNALKSDRINVGQKLKLPAKAGGAPSVPVESSPLLPPATAPAVPAIVPTTPGR